MLWFGIIGCTVSRARPDDGARSEALQSSRPVRQENFTEMPLLFRLFHAPRHALNRSRVDLFLRPIARGATRLPWTASLLANSGFAFGRPVKQAGTADGLVRSRKNALRIVQTAGAAQRCAHSGGATSPVMASSATTRRTSLGRKGFSITGRPLSQTNSRIAEARVSPVTKTTRPERPGQRRSISW